MTARDLFDRYRRVLLAKDWRGLGELLAPDAAFEFPFVPPGVPAARTGREAMVAAARDGWGKTSLEFRELRARAIHGDDAAIAAECELVTQVGAFAMAIVLHAREGKISLLREYLDLLGLAGPTGRAVAIADHLLGHAPRAMWERMIEHHRTGDIEGYAALFGETGVMELAFAMPGVPIPKQMVGRDDILRVLAPLWAASRASGRRVIAYDPVVAHLTRDPDVVVVEFDVVGEDGAGAAYRLSYVHSLRIAGDRIARLRDYVDVAALTARGSRAASPGS
jgi:ketosteroid isomerase-like protein